MAVSPAAPARPVARLNARISAYLVDSVILLAFVLAFFVLAGLLLLVAADGSSGDPSDAAIAAALAVFSGGVLLSWTAFNVALMRWRGQTAGKYVIGIKLVSEDATPLTMGRTLVRWFGLHPLLFHPLLLLPWSMLTLLSVSFALSRMGLVLVLALVMLSVASLVVNLLAVLIDSERRALYDRLAGTLVIHIEQP